MGGSFGALLCRAPVAYTLCVSSSGSSGARRLRAAPSVGTWCSPEWRSGRMHPKVPHILARAHRGMTRLGDGAIATRSSHRTTVESGWPRVASSRGVASSGSSQNRATSRVSRRRTVASMQDPSSSSSSSSSLSLSRRRGGRGGGSDGSRGGGGGSGGGGTSAPVTARHRLRHCTAVRPGRCVHTSDQLRSPSRRTW